jgi:hypothetical protein
LRVNGGWFATAEARQTGRRAHALVS